MCVCVCVCVSVSVSVSVSVFQIITTLSTFSEDEAMVEFLYRTPDRKAERQGFGKRRLK